MTKKQEPQMMICLDASNGHCSKKNCPHYSKHELIPETMLDKYGLVKLWACDQDVSVGSHRDCTPCIEYVEPSPEIRCTAGWNESNCLDKATCPVTSGGDICGHAVIKPEPEMSLKQQIAKIACLNCDSKDDCTSEMIDKKGDGDCAITRNLMNRFNAWLPAHDQQVRKAFAEECIKTMPLIKSGITNPNDAGLANLVNSTALEEQIECIAHIRAMAEKGER